MSHLQDLIDHMELRGYGNTGTPGEKYFLVLGEPKGNGVKMIMAELSKRGHKAVAMHPSEIDLFVSNSDRGYDTMIMHGTECKPSQIRAVISRNGAGTTYGLAVLEHLQKNLGIPCTNGAEAVRMAADKFFCHQKLSQARLKQPKTVYSKQPQSIKQIIEKLGGLPVVGKILAGSQGKGIFILETKLAANTTLESFLHLDADLILQEYLPDTQDVRAWIIGGKFVAAMERLKIKNDFRKNASLGAEAQKITLTPEEIAIAEKAATTLGLGVSGVDLLLDRKNGKTYVLEVNSSPGMDKMSEVFPEINFPGLIVDYAERIARK